MLDVENFGIFVYLHTSQWKSAKFGYILGAGFFLFKTFVLFYFISFFYQLRMVGKNLFFPFIPQIVNPPKDLKKPRGKKCFFVKFFGTEDQ